MAALAVGDEDPPLGHVQITQAQPENLAPAQPAQDGSPHGTGFALTSPRTRKNANRPDTLDNRRRIVRADTPTPSLATCSRPNVPPVRWAVTNPNTSAVVTPPRSAHDCEEDAQVVGRREHRVRPTASCEKLQIRIQLRHTKPHHKITRCVPRNAAGTDPLHSCGQPLRSRGLPAYKYERTLATTTACCNAPRRRATRHRLTLTRPAGSSRLRKHAATPSCHTHAPRGVLPVRNLASIRGLDRCTTDWKRLGDVTRVPSELG
jgi:hypothetical protein